MITNHENQSETNQKKTVDNIQNNLDPNSQAQEKKESLDVHQEGKNLSSKEVDVNKNPDEEQAQNSQEETREQSSLQVDRPETKPEEKLSADNQENLEAETKSASVDEQIRTEIIESLQAQVNQLKEQLEQQKRENEANKAQYLRIVADFENFRRRTIKEKEDLEQQIKKKTINELLSVVDNFERARTQIKPANDGEMAIHKSYQGVYKNLVDSLKKVGVSAMRPEGKPFDPNYHEAMLRQPTNEYPEGIVIEQLVRGYLLNEEILRHAMVKVAAPLENESEEDSDSAVELEQNDSKID